MSLAYLRHLARLGTADIHPWGAAGTAALLAALDVQPGVRVLELGCGTGQTLLRLAAGNQATVIGVELLPEMLAAAQQRLRLAGRLPVALVCGRGERLPLAANSVDRVVTESVLGFQDTVVAEQMLAEVWRVLRPGGLYVANEAVWRGGVPAETAAALNARSLADFGLRHATDRLWTAAEWRQVMAAAGFELLSVEVMRLELRRDMAEGPARLYRWRGWLHPGLLWQRWQYRRRLRRHAVMMRAWHEEDVIEGCLFVLRKPETVGGGNS